MNNRQQDDSQRHPQELQLVSTTGSGTLTDEALKLYMEGTPKQREALNAQALRQEVYGTKLA